MFEWHEDKRQINLAKHGLDLVVGRDLFDGRPVLTLPSRFLGEERFITTGLIEAKLLSIVWTWRDEKRRLISFRKARDGEKTAYRQLHG
jgi:uncharacterized DUF497 family protein